MKMPMKVKIALVEGDGSGPEMMGWATTIAIAAAKKDGVEIEFVPTPMGWNAYEKYGDTLPEESLAKATELKLLFFGGVGDPKYDATIGKEKPEMMPEARALLTIRSKWELLINTRPVIFYPELRGIAKVKPETIPEEGVKQIWLRFLLQDSYFGNRDHREYFPGDFAEKKGMLLKHQVKGTEVIVSDLAYYCRATLEDYFCYAFKIAEAMKLPLISVDKANVMARYVLWRKVIERIAKDFPGVSLKSVYVDNACQMLFTPSLLHGVIVCGNEHGDILSDGAAESVGSLGLMCSSAINPETRAAMFESGAGTAPTLAGQNKANPIGRILASALMLRHIGAEKGAQAIEKSVFRALQAGWRTPDLATSSDNPVRILGTAEMGESILGGVTA